MGSCLGHPFSGLTQMLLTCLDKMKGEASMQQQTASLYLKAEVREKHITNSINLGKWEQTPNVRRVEEQ